MAKLVHHNFLHILFVAGIGFTKDLSGLLIGSSIIIVDIFLITSKYLDIFKIVVGVPLGVVGVSIVIINFQGFINLLRNKSYQVNHCPFCEDRAS